MESSSIQPPEEVAKVIESNVVEPMANIVEEVAINVEKEVILSTNSYEQLVDELLEKTNEAKKKLKVVKDNASFSLVGSKEKKKLQAATIFLEDELNKYFDENGKIKK